MFSTVCTISKVMLVQVHCACCVSGKHSLEFAISLLSLRCLMILCLLLSYVSVRTFSVMCDHTRLHAHKEASKTLLGKMDMHVTAFS